MSTVHLAQTIIQECSNLSREHHCHIAEMIKRTHGQLMHQHNDGIRVDLEQLPEEILQEIYTYITVAMNDI